MSESWAKRELFEIRFPLECTMYLDAILLRYHKEPWNERTNARVRQLYPSTKTSSYDMHITANNTQSETLTHWRSSSFLISRLVVWREEANYAQYNYGFMESGSWRKQTEDGKGSFYNPFYQ